MTCMMLVAVEHKKCSRCGETKAASMFYKNRGRPRAVCSHCWGEQNKMARAAKLLAESEGWPRPSDEVACNMAFSQWRAACRESLPIGLVATL